MQTIYYKLPSGIEIVDDTPEAELRLNSMEYLEKRENRKLKIKSHKNFTKNKNILWKLVFVFGIIKKIE